MNDFVFSLAPLLRATSRLLAGIAGVAGSGLIAACAAADPSFDCRVAVKLVAASTDAEAIERRVAGAAGVSARHAATIGPAWHALVLRCDDATACDAAIDRLRAATQLFDAVERDRRRRAAPG